MTSRTQQPAPHRNIWRIIGWGGAVALLLTPLVAMQFTREVDWDETDFIFAAVIFGIVGGLIELAVRASANWYFRIGAFFAVLSGFMAVWANAAVGLIGDGNNFTSLLIVAVLGIAALGAILSRFHSRILPTAMFAAGTAQTAIGLFAGILGTDHRGGVFTIILASGWMISGALLWIARKG